MPNRTAVKKTASGSAFLVANSMSVSFNESKNSALSQSIIHTFRHRHGVTAKMQSVNRNFSVQEKSCQTKITSARI